MKLYTTINEFKHYLINENINQTDLQNRYTDVEKGIIKAWGGLLFLTYHVIDNKISKIVPLSTTLKTFVDYYNETDEDKLEDYDDWFSDEPPTMNKGYALYDKNRLDTLLTQIANKTKLTKELIVYRTSTIDHNDGWSSYTTNSDSNYSWHNGETKQRRYKLPIGFPVIFADKIADNDEVIINLNKENKDKFNF